MALALLPGILQADVIHYRLGTVNEQSEADILRILDTTETGDDVCIYNWG